MGRPPGLADVPTHWLADLIGSLDPWHRRQVAGASRHIHDQVHKHPGVATSVVLHLPGRVAYNAAVLAWLRGLTSNGIHIRMVLTSSMTEQQLEQVVLNMFQAAAGLEVPSSWSSSLTRLFSRCFKPGGCNPDPSALAVDTALPTVRKVTLEGKNTLFRGRPCRTSTRVPSGVLPVCLGQFLPNLEQLSISNMNLKVQQVSSEPLDVSNHLAAAFPRLASLDVANVSFKGPGMHCMSYLTHRQLQALSKLTSLNLSNTNVLDKCAVCSRTGIFSRLSTITVASIEDLFPTIRDPVYLGVGAHAVSKLLPTQPLTRLRHLMLTSGCLSGPQIRTLLKYAPNLRSLAAPGLGKVGEVTNFAHIPCLWETVAVGTLLLNTLPKLPLARVKRLDFQRLYYHLKCTGPNTTLDDLDAGCALLSSLPSTKFYYMAACCSWHPPGTGVDVKALLPKVALCIYQLAMRGCSPGSLCMFLTRLRDPRRSRLLRIRQRGEEWAKELDQAVACLDFSEPYGTVVVLAVNDLHCAKWKPFSSGVDILR